jgi:iron(III) transport system ATP-binding protein
LIVLLDEPFASIDPDLRSRMRMDLKQILKEAGVTAVFVTHDQEEAFLMADRVAVMNEGKIHQIGTPVDIYHHPRDRFVAEFVGKADFIQGKVHSTNVTTEIGEFILDSAIHVEDGSEVSVMIRPGEIDVVPAEFGTGVVESLEFKGEDTVYSIRLKSGQMIHSSQHASSIHTVGTKVMVVANPVHLIMFKDDELSIKMSCKNPNT